MIMITTIKGTNTVAINDGTGRLIITIKGTNTVAINDGTGRLIINLNKA